MDANTLPKGHIVGWTPPPASSSSASAAAKSKSAKKNEKRKEKRKADKTEETKVKDDWEDEDDEETAAGVEKKDADSAQSPNWAAASDGKDGKAAKVKAQPVDDDLADKIGKLQVQ